ncbi:TPA: hypothetical protein ACU967_005932 [Burkholderia contaminans]|uniref:hypothetical protein n=1 Tax=Burkholderia cepacia complex TaxID=87882 RepID=UPI0012D8D949|nr:MULTISPECIES: hypothetical protein [Burkholderia cepacia complex]MBM6430548.1 hypothetical protein [Burkholderia contaminans]MCA7880870.1 hypothetical protein [Burkholderia contaminans]MDN8025806.1 hypothetical protein [Burkholderia contaminans]
MAIKFPMRAAEEANPNHSGDTGNHSPRAMISHSSQAASTAPENAKSEMLTMS